MKFNLNQLLLNMQDQTHYSLQEEVHASLEGQEVVVKSKKGEHIYPITKIEKIYSWAGNDPGVALGYYFPFVWIYAKLEDITDPVIISKLTLLPNHITFSYIPKYIPINLDAIESILQSKGNINVSDEIKEYLQARDPYVFMKTNKTLTKQNIYLPIAIILALLGVLVVILFFH